MLQVGGIGIEEEEEVLRSILNFPFAVNKRSPISLKRKTVLQ
jgi:hypothetical protein